MPIIDAAQAAAIPADADHVPYLILNERGQRQVSTWAYLTTKNPGTQRAQAWYEAAERAANDVGPDESIVIEMRGDLTASGAPETLNIDRAGFDWFVAQ